MPTAPRPTRAGVIRRVRFSVVCSVSSSAMSPILARGPRPRRSKVRPLAAAALLVVALGASVLAISYLTAANGRRTGGVTMVGDSLNVGTEPYLEQRLDGWTIS